MTTALFNNGSSIDYSNKDINPPTACFLCKGSNLVHNFTAGPLSNEYNDTKCNDCKAISCYGIGLTHYNVEICDRIISWFDIPDGLHYAPNPAL